MLTKRLVALAASLTIGGLALGGCSGASQDSTDNADQSGGAAIETMFGPVLLPAGDPEDWNVVALGWSDAEAALALGIKPVAVFDWMSFGEEQKGVGDWATPMFGDDVPVVFPNVDQTFDYEAISELNPDLILYVRSAYDPEQYERLSSIAPTIAGSEGAGPYVIDWREHTRMIAESLKQETEGSALIAQVDEEIAQARAENPDFSDLTGAAGAKFGDAYGAYLPGDARWDLLNELGFELNPPIAELDASGYFASVSVEQVPVFDADVAVLLPIGYSLAELENDPVINSLAVVKDGRAVFLAPDSQIAEAFNAMSIQSLPVAIDQLVPLLSEAAAKVK